MPSLSWRSISNAPSGAASRLETQNTSSVIDATSPTSINPTTTTLDWLSSNPINPTVRLTDTSAMAALQQWLVVAAVGLGIGGSMLASLAFEWLRPSNGRLTYQASKIADRAAPFNAQLQQSRRGNVMASNASVLATAFVAVAIAIGLVRHRRRN